MPRMSIEKNEYGITYKMEQFCREYVANGYKGGAAYKAAYNCHSDNSARVNAWQLLKRPEIKAYIRMLQKEQYEALSISAERIATELAEMAFANKGDEHYTATVKLKALDLLQKQLGLQQSKVKAEVEAAQDIAVTIDDQSDPG